MFNYWQKYFLVFLFIYTQSLIAMEDNNYASLRLAIKHKNIEAIKQLCSAKASPINIDNYNNTVFHIASDKSDKVIKTLMTHVNITHVNNNDLTNTIKTLLLVFHRFDNDSKSNIFNIPHIPHEIQIFILSKLLSANFFHQGLYKQCNGKNYHQLHLKLINEHVENLKQILQIRNNFQNTAINVKFENPGALICRYRSAEEKLLNGTTLQEDLDILNGNYPDLSSIPKENLALQILENHYTFKPK